MYFGLRFIYSFIYYYFFFSLYRNVFVALNVYVPSRICACYEILGFKSFHQISTMRFFFFSFHLESQIQDISLTFALSIRSFIRWLLNMELCKNFLTKIQEIRVTIHLSTSLEWRLWKIALTVRIESNTLIYAFSWWQF